MATNADNILNNSNTSGDDPYSKHWEAAGIEDDNTNNEDNSGNEEGTDQTEDTGAKEGEGEQNKTDQQQRDGKDSRDGSGKDGKSQQQSKDGKGKKDEGPARDPNKGRVNAEANRWREQYTVETQRRKGLENEIKQMTNSRDNWKQRHDDMQRTVQSTNGASPQELSLGVTIVRDMQRDPVGTLRKLLTEAVAHGHTIEGIGAGVDTAAITRLIEQRTTPPSNTAEQNTDADINNAISQFYGQYPDARVHDATLARVLTDHPQLSLTEAMFELKSEFAKRGLDWNKSIDDDANMAVLRPSGDQDSQQQQQKPMPNGRRVVNPNSADKVSVAHETTDTSDIVKAAMRENGLNI